MNETFKGFELIDGTLQSDLVPQEVEYYALLPIGYQASEEPLPLVINLHGGGGSREVLKSLQPQITALIDSGELPAMVFATPSVATGTIYMDFKDGSQNWESFLIRPFLHHIRERFNVRSDQSGTLLTGISMGGIGALRLAFKYPEVFGAVAALEPAIDPISDWRDKRAKHSFWKEDARVHSIYGNPVDRNYWNDNNPATIAERDAAKILASELKIFLEVGDEDLFWLYEGTEHLHQVLYSNKIRHEYHLYYGADHVGRSVEPRTEKALLFLGNTLEERKPEPDIVATREYLASFKQDLRESDHYGIDSVLIRNTQ